MKTTKKALAILLTLVFALVLMAGCAQPQQPTAQEQEPAVTPAEQAQSAASEPTAQAEAYTVGVIQFGSHPSLDNCFAGVEQALTAAGNVTIDLQNGNFDSATCDTIAKNMAAKNYDMIIGIATPAAVSAYAAAANTDIPVVFCAVSDPVAAGLVDSMEAPGGNCTGTSDVLDFAAQLSLITTLQPAAKSIGILYTTSEANSVSQLAQIKSIASEYGVEIVEQGVQGAADIPQAAATLASKVDCINNFTDNNVVNNLSILLEQANAAGIPVYGSEEEQVINGCLASVGIDYIALGNVTGEMALSVLAGEDAAAMAVRQITDATPIVNTDVLAAFGIQLPEAYANASMVKTGEE
ncbi:MAG: ABC transporter substrate-binding protein [Clostridia bacterium]|nr:ABC transporter substrate-binding protein [Candidatus Pelethousia sp.]NCB31570.1 ABC transporter substrate-binding protein [Clostridia bacterium]